MDPSLFKIPVHLPRGKPCADSPASSLSCWPAIPRQIEHGEFGRGMTQQMGEVAEPLSVLQAKGIPATAYRSSTRPLCEKSLARARRSFERPLPRRSSHHDTESAFHLIPPSACKGSCPTGTTVREFSRTLTHRCRPVSLLFYASSAEFRASIKSSSLKGLFKNLIAPARTACSRVFASRRSVMKMTGIGSSQSGAVATRGHPSQASRRRGSRRTRFEIEGSPGNRGPRRNSQSGTRSTRANSRELRGKIDRH